MSVSVREYMRVSVYESRSVRESKCVRVSV